MRAANYFRSLKDAQPLDSGQTLVEYSLLLAFIALALIGAVGLFQVGLSGLTQGIIDTLIALFG